MQPDAVNPPLRWHRAGTCLLLVAEPFENGALQLPLLEDGGLERLLQTGAGAQGRGRTAIVPLPGRSERLHLRVVRHGGLLGGLYHDLLFGLRRPIAELRVNARLAVAGAPVPRPVLVAARRRVATESIARLSPDCECPWCRQW